jgi:hypothetical protein
MSDPINADVKMDALLRALDSFRWLGNNLHNITESPKWFRAYYEAALEDAEAARAAVWADRPRPKR